MKGSSIATKEVIKRMKNHLFYHFIRYLQRQMKEEATSVHEFERAFKRNWPVIFGRHKELASELGMKGSSIATKEVIKRMKNHLFYHFIRYLQRQMKEEATSVHEFERAFKRNWPVIFGRHKELASELGMKGSSIATKEVIKRMKNHLFYHFIRYLQRQMKEEATSVHNSLRGHSREIGL